MIQIYDTDMHKLPTKLFPEKLVAIVSSYALIHVYAMILVLMMFL